MNLYKNIIKTRILSFWIKFKHQISKWIIINLIKLFFVNNKIFLRHEPKQRAMVHNLLKIEFSIGLAGRGSVRDSGIGSSSCSGICLDWKIQIISPIRLFLHDISCKSLFCNLFSFLLQFCNTHLKFSWIDAFNSMLFLFHSNKISF